MCLGIVELHDLDTAEIIMITSILRIAGVGWESSLGYELVRLIEEAVVDVVAEKAVDQGSLRFVVMSERSGTLRGEQEPVI